MFNRISANRFFFLAGLLLLNSLCLTAGDGKEILNRRQGFWSTPEGENNHGWFSELTHPKSQREDWYEATPYIAESLCTISNIGFFVVAAKNMGKHPIGSMATGIAGITSTVSHAIPKQWLNTVDKICAAAAVVGVGYECVNLCEGKIGPNLGNANLIIPLIATGAIYVTDTYLGQCKSKRYKSQKWIHSAWHILAAITLNAFLSQK